MLMWDSIVSTVVITIYMYLFIVKVRYFELINKIVIMFFILLCCLNCLNEY